MLCEERERINEKLFGGYGCFSWFVSRPKHGGFTPFHHQSNGVTLCAHCPKLDDKGYASHPVLKHNFSISLSTKSLFDKP